MTHDIAFLEKVYERMHQAGLVESKAVFSMCILGKGPSYLTSMSARDRNVPEEVIVHLRERIETDSSGLVIKAAELEEDLRRCKLEQACRSQVLLWIAEEDGKDVQVTDRKRARRLLLGWLNILLGGSAAAI
jgi:hypothetical protein